MSPHRHLPCAAMTTTHTAAAVLLAAAAVLGACNNNDDETAQQSTTTTVAPTNTNEPTTISPTTTSLSTTTTIAPTTTTSTIAPTTTAPPTVPQSTTPLNTLVTPEQIAEAQEADRLMAEAVTRDWMTANRLFREAQMNPSDPAALDRVLAYVTPEWAERTKLVLQRLRDNNLRILESPPVEPRLVVESAPVPVAFTSDEVTIVVCEVDPWVIVEIGTGPDGSDTVVRDTVSASRQEIRLRLLEGIWKIAEVRQLQDFEGATSCA